MKDLASTGWKVPDDDIQWPMIVDRDIWPVYETSQRARTFNTLTANSIDTATVCAIDVGANIGVHSVAFGGIFASVIAFEPIPQTHECLVTNVSAHAGDNITIVNAAVSNSTGTIDMYQDLDFCCASSVYQDVTVGNTAVVSNVTSTTLDDYLAANPPAQDVGFLKIDTEEHELAVLQGASTTIQTYAPVIWIDLPTRHRDYDAIYAHLQSKGYELREHLDAMTSVWSKG